jgi:hypothetical protein
MPLCGTGRSSIALSLPVPSRWAIYATDNIGAHEEALQHEGEPCECRNDPRTLTCPDMLRTGKVFQDTRWATNAVTHEVEVEEDRVYVYMNL